jgi:hypothetical protein
MNYYKNQSGSMFREGRSWPDNIFKNAILYNTGNYIKNFKLPSCIRLERKIFKFRATELAQ